MGFLDIDNATKSYGAVEVLHQVDISVEEGEFLVLVGPSGCGKSTLLNMIAGLEEITSGEIRIKDQVMNVANAPGKICSPGELAKALQILADGGEVDYVGATAVELIGPGESAGNYRQIEIKDGAISTVQYR